MRFDIITIFPEIINAYLNESIIKRGRKRGFLDVRVHDLRDYTDDKHRTVDDRPFGGGPGMVIKLEPLVRVISNLQLSIFKQISNSKSQNTKPLVILTSAAGKQFDSKKARIFAKKYDHIILIAGRYEGVDERIKKVIENWKLKIENLSIGPYVLTGGELPALVVLDAVSRHIPGILGKDDSLEERRYGVGVSTYTRPEVFEYKGRKYKIPKVLKSGDHKKIEDWRKHHKI